MTGGQDAAGAMPVPELTRSLTAEGVKRIVVMTDEPDKYPAGTVWDSGVEVWHRDRLDEAQRLLRDIPGVTALVYDQRCAAEKRRLRKRDRLPDPSMRVFINEAVCEGCGDCGVKSNCLSVHPVETEFGRKTQIHQSSCNKDYSCLKGDCPSFVTIVPLGPPQKKERRVFKVDQTLPEPALKVPRDANIFMMGIGGTGVVTVNQVLGTAALLDGKHVRGLDQTGLSQKGGPVVSHLKIFEHAPEGSNKISAGSADCYLGFDILVATSPQNLDHARSDRTIAVISTSEVPTGAMVTSTTVEFPETNGLVMSIDRVTRKDENVYLDALGLAEMLFDDHMAANMIVLGAAWQAGAIPVSATAIEEAIVLNGVSVPMNSHAFRVGRRLVADPAWAQSLTRRRVGAIEDAPALSAEARQVVDAAGAAGELKRLLEVRVPSPAEPATRIDNVGSMRNQGLEVSLDALLASHPRLTWRAGLVFAVERNKVLDLGGGPIPSGIVSGQGQSDTRAERLIPGYPLGTFWGPVFVGFDATGRQLFQCSTGAKCVNGKTTSDGISASDYTVLGNANPDFTVGLHNQVTWGNFNLNFLVRVAVGQDVFNNTALVYSTKGNALQDKNFLRAALTDSTALHEPSVYSSRWIERASFLRLQNVTLEYNLNLPVFTQSARSARLYVSADNLFVITGYSGLDPEVSSADQTNIDDVGPAARGMDYLSYPRPRTFTAGLRLAF